MSYIHDSSLLPAQIEKVFERLLPRGGHDYFALPFKSVIPQGGTYVVNGSEMQLDAGDEFESPVPITIKRVQ